MFVGYILLTFGHLNSGCQSYFGCIRQMGFDMICIRLVRPSGNVQGLKTAPCMVEHCQGEDLQPTLAFTSHLAITG